MKPRGYIYTCVCGYEERTQANWRGIPCINCDKVMHRNKQREQELKQIKWKRNT